MGERERHWCQKPPPVCACVMKVFMPIVLGVREEKGDDDEMLCRDTFTSAFGLYLVTKGLLHRLALASQCKTDDCQLLFFVCFFFCLFCCRLRLLQEQPKEKAKVRRIYMTNCVFACMYVCILPDCRVMRLLLRHFLAHSKEMMVEWKKCCRLILLPSVYVWRWHIIQTHRQRCCFLFSEYSVLATFPCTL